MNNQHDSIARDIFHGHIKKSMIGPGSDIFIDNSLRDECLNEIISDFPLQRYFSGILFPEKGIISTREDESDYEIENETNIDDLEDDIDINKSNNTDFEDETVPLKNKGEQEDDSVKYTNSNFFPTNIGLTFCVDSKIKEIEAEFKFGLYSQIQKDIKIKISENIYEEFKNHPTFPLKDIIYYDNGHMVLKRKLKGKSRSPRTEEYAFLDEFKKTDEFKNSALKANFHYFDKLIGRTWKRKDYNIKQKVLIKDVLKPIIIFENNLTKKTNNFLRIGYTIKTYKLQKNPSNIYIKIQLVNISDKHPPNKFSNANESFNLKSVFQAKIIINTKGLKPYKSYIELNPLDDEAEVLNYLYKDKFNYGIGHNCAVWWDENKHQIETTFLPEYDIKDTKNNFTQEDFKEHPEDFKILNNSLDIYNLSHFSQLTKVQIIDKLNNFINLYGRWIDNLKKRSSVNREVENRIFSKLDYNYSRLKSNLNLLSDPFVFKAFLLANTSMFIQIVISNDKDFSGKEKDLTDINTSIDYKSLDFFKNYDFNRLPFHNPRYRPFQLAFLLLNLDSIIDQESNSRKNIVDLIWFPTGGGKTEAYLAVAAFTIIYRRLTNQNGYEGTSVIMRYTLRLLTAQQFERASRLISALEFLRTNFEEDLRFEPITIGMWVGMASTPNTLRETKEKVESLNEECNKKNGNPEQKNVFQLSSCPWCGCKLISKNEYGKWEYGFNISGKGKNINFKIKCVNKYCHFHDELPIQVVDEVLYKKPPTLLFGTVDKFALLAWRPEGNKFFNSLDDTKLPPDLIIQDELHLLSGPLGSITGIFESVIEILSTKNGRKPKIISSTATTRNTNEQIKALYGKDKSVNIFPPSGLSYDDSFFAKVSSSKSKRRYIGFLPTGKSSIDTQLHLLSNLFVARLEVYKALILNGLKDYKTFDKYWTLVSYYNSLKDVGRIHNKVGDEIINFTSAKQLRIFGDNPADKFNYAYLYNRDVELTSRVESKKIKQTLKMLEENIFDENTIKKSENGSTYATDIIDLVLATNMISVGIDIERFNIMLINGQPKNIAEYIQASSRVGRKYKGLVITLLDASRARDKSYFEHFKPFHQAFYKSVEPISITPFTENTINKMLATIIITYIRHKVPGMASNTSAKKFKPEMLEGLKKEIKSRFNFNLSIYEYFEKKINELSEDWMYQIEHLDLNNYEKSSKEIGLLRRPSDKESNDDDLWFVMQSMREIDTNSFIKIEAPKPKLWNNG